MIPSIEALQRHWKRSCWATNMWGHADRNKIELPDLTSWGWKVNNEQLSIDWDSSENLSTIKERVRLLTKGCKCV